MFTGHLEGDLMGLGDKFFSLTGRNDEPVDAHASTTSSLLGKSNSDAVMVQVPVEISAVIPGPNPAMIPRAPSVNDASSNIRARDSSTTALAMFPNWVSVVRLKRNSSDATPR